MYNCPSLLYNFFSVFHDVLLNTPLEELLAATPPSVPSVATLEVAAAEVLSEKPKVLRRTSKFPKLKDFFFSKQTNKPKSAFSMTNENYDQMKFDDFKYFSVGDDSNDSNEKETKVKKTD